MGLTGVFKRAVFACAVSLPLAAMAERDLLLHNLHTEETLHVIYKRGDEHDREMIAEISWLLRDHRRNEAVQINPGILDRLYEIGQRVKRNFPDMHIEFQVISGYRSDITNRILRARGGGQAEQSQHTLGNAIDFRIPGVSTQVLRDIAVCTGEGGTGYYARDGFVHIDTARTRFWPGTWSPGQVDCARYP
jgi:uncharacterized protein YcbK (DUF882 family)